MRSDRRIVCALKLASLGLHTGPNDLDLHARDPELASLMRQRQHAWVIAAKIAGQWDLEDKQKDLLEEICKLTSPS